MDNNNLVFFMFHQIGPELFRNTQVAMPCVGGCGCLLHTTGPISTAPPPIPSYCNL
ncbi:hypothetical protein GBA52_011745 [Prunus armeniaca]|nr:hypothetical protein GBA52_025536 [Prunus armeniaca]KAH0984568.1 hypothetical protein GBA52_011745 [Prunus armeniaca]